LGLSIVTLAGCANTNPGNVKTHVEANTKYDYQQLSSFSIEPKQFVGAASDAEGDIYDSVKSVLTTKGYQFNDSKGDFAVEFYARRKEEKKMVMRPVVTAAGQFTEYRMEDFLQGALVVHLRDTKTNEVFWKNTLSAEGKHRAEGEELKKRIQYAVERIFKAFPNK
jgi:hypothetical protein